MAARRDRPNFVIVLTDDLGYGDIGCYGAADIDTPNIDRMAAGGVRFTNYCVAAPTCTASRAALLTGCYAQRISLPDILVPWTPKGLGTEEQTIAAVLKGRGYATACYGKWHLGAHPEFLPTRHGFDEYFGLPYSNDMWPNHPVPDRASRMPPLPLIQDETVIEYNPDLTQLTTWYTERAVAFIERNRDRPFFVYLPHSMPHVPLAVSDKFKGKSRRGLYGDVIMEIDWSVGRILETLERLGLERDTLVILTSDNGPWLEYGEHGGSQGPLREGKWTTFEGGQRVPCVMRAPGRLPAGRVCDELVTELDILPTFAALAGAQLPGHEIDGRDVGAVLACRAPSPHEAFFHYRGYSLEAIRCGRWKLHLPHPYMHVIEGGRGGKPGRTSTETIGLELFDLEDLHETRDVAADHPDVVERLLALGAAFDRRLREGRRRSGEVQIDGGMAGGRLYTFEVTGGRVSPERGGYADGPLEWTLVEPGARLTLGLPIPKDGLFRMSMTLSGEGRFAFALDGQPVGAPVDATATSALVWQGSLRLLLGVRRLTVERLPGAPAQGRLVIERVRAEAAE